MEIEMAISNRIVNVAQEVFRNPLSAIAMGLTVASCSTASKQFPNLLGGASAVSEKLAENSQVALFGSASGNADLKTAFDLAKQQQGGTVAVQVQAVTHGVGGLFANATVTKIPQATMAVTNYEQLFPQIASAIASRDAAGKDMVYQILLTFGETKSYGGALCKINTAGTLSFVPNQPATQQQGTCEITSGAFAGLGM
jgi:hypothetical protein